MPARPRRHARRRRRGSLVERLARIGDDERVVEPLQRPFNSSFVSSGRISTTSRRSSRASAGRAASPLDRVDAASGTEPSACPARRAPPLRRRERWRRRPRGRSAASRRQAGAAARESRGRCGLRRSRGRGRPQHRLARLRRNVRRPLRTRETVAIETPAASATSVSLPAPAPSARHKARKRLQDSLARGRAGFSSRAHRGVWWSVLEPFPGR